MTKLSKCKRCGFQPFSPNPKGNKDTDVNGNPVIYVGFVMCSCYEPEDER